MNPFLATDGYKVGHHLMYPENTTLVYSNFTPRSNKHAPKGCDKVVSFGQQMIMKQINEMFHLDFFGKPKADVCGEIKKEYSEYLGVDFDATHIEELHDLGYLPIRVKALKEGTLVPMGVPVLTIVNTLPNFYWLTNLLETLVSNLLWKPITSATIAHRYKTDLTYWANKTDKENVGFVDFQGHDFSMRGMDSLAAAMSSGLGHATSFLGSDSLTVIHGARKFYHETGGVVYSVNATEHSVMCAGTKDDEIETFRYLMKQFPTGVLSIVSDTWDLWKVCTEILPELKDEIMERDGKIVIRPDSGDPAQIICGDQVYTEYENNNPMYKVACERAGVVQLLWDVFGGTTNDQGYKVLDPHIGVIYGDSITIERANDICNRLHEKKFASTNVVLGIGSFTYQYNTRDTFGFAMKATYVEVDGEGREIFKDPITDDGTKKSAKGLISVFLDDNMEYFMQDQCNWDAEDSGELKPIYTNGSFEMRTTLNQIREQLNLKISNLVKNK